MHIHHDRDFSGSTRWNKEIVASLSLTRNRIRDAESRDISALSKRLASAVVRASGPVSQKVLLSFTIVRSSEIGVGLIGASDAMAVIDGVGSNGDWSYCWWRRLYESAFLSFLLL